MTQQSSSSQSQAFWAEALEAVGEFERDIDVGAGGSGSRVEPGGGNDEAEQYNHDIGHRISTKRTASDTPPKPPSKIPKTSSFEFFSILSPNTSDLEPDPDEEEAGAVHGDGGEEEYSKGGGNKPRRTVHFASHPSSIPQAQSPLPSSSPPDHPPSSPLADISTTVTYLPAQTSAAGSHAYLQRPEYAANTFGDIGSYLRNKDLKVQTQNAEIAAAAAASNLPQIFTGLVFYINGNTSPPMEVLRRMILQRGGKVVPFVRRKTEIDYVVAPVLTLAKFREWQNIKLVTEAFVTQSCEAERVVDWRKWRLRPPGEGPADLFSKQREKEVKDRLETPKAAKVEDGNPFHTPARPVAATGKTPIAASTSLLTPTPAKQSIPQTPVAATQSLLRPLRAFTPRLSQVPRASQTPSQAMPPPATPKPVTTSMAPPPPPARAPTTTESSVNSSTNASDSGPIPDGHSTATATPAPAPAEKRPEGAWDNYFVHKSNKQAAVLMKSDAFRARHTSERGNDSGFIDQFYQNSRLHHLSTWKAELRVLVAEARSAAVRAPTVLSTPGQERTYFHVDFDAFFVSAGLASRPHLRGRPVVVCHSSRGGRESTSEVASASYEARAKGVKNGMSLGRARQLVGPELQTIPYEFDAYKRHSAQFYTVLLGYADELEAVSVDEALLDVTGAVLARALAPDAADARSSDPAMQVADQIRDDIRAATGCEVSIGIAHNILLARLATRKAKPAGVFRLTADAAPAFLADLDVDQLPSVGHSLRSKISDAFGTTKCGALLTHSKAALQRVLGPKTGETIHAFLRGQDSRTLQPDKERKSVSAEMNYGIRFQNAAQADKYLADLSAEVAKRLRNIGAKGRHITLKIMTRHPDAPVEPPKFLGHGRCEAVNKSAAMRSLTDDDKVIAAEATRLLAAMRLDPTELRGVGIMITKLVVTGTRGQSLLDFGIRKSEEEETVDEDDQSGFQSPPSQDVDAADVLETPAPARTLSRPDLAPTSLLHEPLLPRPQLAPPPAPEPQPAAPHSTPRLSQSSDRIDPDFLAALPSSLRKEVEADHAAQRAAKRQRVADLEVAKQVAAELQKEKSRDDPVTAVAAKSKRNPAAHITRQLRPKLKTHMGAKAIAELPLYDAWSRADPGVRGRKRSREVEDEAIVIPSDEDDAVDEDRDRDQSVDRGPSREDSAAISLSDSDSDIEVLATSHGPSDAELRALGIDPAVFAALPPSVRREVVAAERERRGIRRTNAQPTRGRRKPRPPVASIRAMAPTRPALFGARSTEEVCAVLDRWVSSRPTPADGDVRRVSAYLAKSVVSGLGGVEHVSALLRCLRGLFNDMEIAAVTEGEDEKSERVGMWWNAWEDMKAAVDQVLLSRLGAPLRL